MDLLDFAMMLIASLLASCIVILVVVIIQLRRLEKSAWFIPLEQSPAPPPRTIVPEPVKRKPKINDDERCARLEQKLAEEKAKQLPY